MDLISVLQIAEYCFVCGHSLSCHMSLLESPSSYLFIHSSIRLLDHVSL